MIWWEGNGEQISIWGDKWLLTPHSDKVQSHVHGLDSEAKACSLIDQNIGWWDYPLIQETFNGIEAD
jgi:hypothetical protein